MKKTILYSLIALIIGVAIYLYIQYKKAMNYCWKINQTSTKIFSMGLKSIKMNLALDFKNNADINLKIYGYSFDVLLNGTKVGSVENSEKQILKANSLSVFNLGIDFSPQQIFNDNKAKLAELAGAFISNKNNIKFTVTGNVTAGVLGIKSEKVLVSIDFTLAELLTPSVEVKEKCK